MTYDDSWYHGATASLASTLSLPPDSPAHIVGTSRSISPTSLRDEPPEAGSSSSASASAVATPKPRPPELVPIQEVEPLAAYTCPICFSPPTYATITPCGHVLCGECLFTAVKTTIQRGAYTLPAGERLTARCPVCRAPIPGWDGKGGGVIGLKPRAVFSL
ncbi:hypothetical protein C8Q76DRAFT_771103 [Earliella scabrosa]|nr:hypothetical protein C8Q76DRAFT_771103 [Earliella scabrosa]